MSVTGTPADSFDPVQIRADFPIFGRQVQGQELAYLDSASTSQKPQAMLDAMTGFYSTSNANVHRGVYTLGIESTTPSRRHVMPWRN